MSDEVGGLCWFALDHVASSVYVPFYSAITDFPETYKTCGRETGFSKKSAWWAFNRLGTITAKRWGDMSPVVTAVWKEMEQEFLANQNQIEKKALDLIKQGKKDDAIILLTNYSNDAGNRAVEKAWETGDYIWTVFDNAW